MLIEQLISPIVPTLTPSDTGNRALFLMEENNFTQLPLVIEDHYMALVKENDVLDWSEPQSPLSLGDFLKYRPAVFAGGHPFDALRIAHAQDLSIIPVVDIEDKYLGAITRHGLLNYITENSGLDTPGAIIVLEMEPRNYTLYEIARICEHQDVHIISTQVNTISDTGLLEVTIKTNRTDLQDVIASFHHHHYKVKEVHGIMNKEEDVQDRFNLLMNYINM